MTTTHALLTVDGCRNGGRERDLADVGVTGAAVYDAGPGHVAVTLRSDQLDALVDRLEHTLTDPEAEGEW
jgi:hypothetical protein